MPQRAEHALHPNISLRDIMILRRMFPNKTPSVTATMSEIQREAGRQDMIDWMEQQIRTNGGIIN